MCHKFIVIAPIQDGKRSKTCWRKLCADPCVLTEMDHRADFILDFVRRIQKTITNFILKQYQKFDNLYS